MNATSKWRAAAVTSLRAAQVAKPAQVEMVQLNPLVKELKQLERVHIENKKMVIQGQNHIQYASLALQAAELSKNKDSKKMEAAQGRLQRGLS
jgi:hypothetical protein